MAALLGGADVIVRGNARVVMVAVLRARHCRLGQVRDFLCLRELGFVEDRGFHEWLALLTACLDRGLLLHVGHVAFSLPVVRARLLRLARRRVVASAVGGCLPLLVLF